jgi:hypothetical protein
VLAGRVGKADEELEVFPVVESSLELEPKKLVMGAWKRRRLVIDSMVMGWEGARLVDLLERSWKGYAGGRLTRTRRFSSDVISHAN